VLREADRVRLVDELHARVLAAGDPSPPDEEALAAELRSTSPLLPQADVAVVASAVAARTSGLGMLHHLLRDPDVTEVMVNGSGDVWVERGGRLAREPLKLPPAEVELLVERIVAPLGLRVDRSCPVADARLPDGSRVNVILPPLSIDGPSLTIRRFGARPIPLSELSPPGVAELLAWAVRARLNVVVSGGTGAGKTTALNALAGELPLTERIVTIEDTAELRLPGEHVVRLEARPATADGLGAFGIRQLVRNSLRMRPDRIVVGEVRGAEALDMLWAMNTGHEGSMSTCHANSPSDAMRRLEVMALQADVDLPLDAVREQLDSAIDLVIQVARLGGGRRGIVEVAEVVQPATAGGLRIRELADRRGLHHLPLRQARVEIEPPDPGWCS